MANLDGFGTAEGESAGHGADSRRMAIFFTSDTHFGHEPIIRLGKRPFASVEEMDQLLIERWNERVGPDDTVYHLGDFCYRSARSIADYRRELNGTIHLIKGNHDTLSEADVSLFASISLISEITVHGQSIVLCHYPFREWDRAWRGAWHFFGHVHGRLQDEPLGYSLDVGVDAHDFRAWTFEEIAAVMATRDNPFTDLR
jgi:calcineurin-like phosphoesterase family protein